MVRFLCPACEEVVEVAGARFAFCVACGAPLTTENMLPFQLLRGKPDQPDEQALAEPTAS